MKNLLNRLYVGSVLLLLSTSAAAQAPRLDNPRATTSADLTHLLARGQNTLQSTADFVVMLFTFSGIVLVGLSLFGLHRAAKDERERPKGAVAGVIIGGCLTAVGTIAILTGNTLNL